MKQTLTQLKGESDSSTIITENFNTPLLVMDTVARHKNQ